MINPNFRRSTRRALLAGCVIGAGLVGNQALQAQAVNATPATVSGAVTYSRFTNPTPGSERVIISSPTALIDWTPPAGVPEPYVFLPEGNVLTFVNSGEVANFTVLNRILSQVPSRFDGTVVSRLRSGQGFVPGGTILFSSPGGIIVGPNALFDVGNLVLTTLNVDDSTGSFINAVGGFTFNGGDDFPNSAVVTEAGARFIATAENSYIALIAPRVVHGGNLSVNGSAAYIAAQAVDVSVKNGLFDIVFTTGTDIGQPIVHTGQTSGPASSGAGDNHAVYMAAMPKNQAVTMLLSGSVGFAAADNIAVENGVIVLSAGHNIVGGAIQDGAPGGLPIANIAVEAGTFTSDVMGRATGNITLATAISAPAFDGSLDLRSAGAIQSLDGGGTAVNVAQDVTLTAGGDIILAEVTTGDDFTATAGGAFSALRVTAAAPGGNIDVTSAGNLSLADAEAGAAINFQSTGGSVSSAGLLDAGSSLQIQAATDLAVNRANGPAFINLTANGSTSADSLTSDGSIFLSAGNNMTVASADSGDSIFVSAGGLAALGNLLANGTISVNSGAILLGSVIADDDIKLTATNDIAVTLAQAGDDFTASAGGGFTGANVRTTRLGLDSEAQGAGEPSLLGSNIRVHANGDIRLDQGDAADSMEALSLGGRILSANLLRSGTGNIDLDSGGDTLIAIAQAGHDFLATAGGAFSAETVTAVVGSDIIVSSVGDLTLNNAAATGLIDLRSSAGSVLSNGLVGAGTILSVNAAQNIALNDSTAGGDLALLAKGDIAVDTATAGDDFTASAGGTFTGNVVTTTGEGADNDSIRGAPPSGGIGSNIDILATGDLRLDNGDSADATRLRSLNGRILSGGLLRARTDIDLDSAGDLTILAAAAGNDFTANSAGTFGASDVSAGHDILVTASGNLALANATASNNIALTSATGSISSTGLLRGNRLDATTALNLALHDVLVVQDLTLQSANGFISGNSFTSGANISLDSAQRVSLAAASSGGAIRVAAAGDADLGDLVANGEVSVAASNIQLASASAGTDIRLAAAGEIALGSAVAGNDFVATAGTTFTGVSIRAGHDISATSVGNLALANADSANLLRLVSSAGSIGSAGTLRANRLDASAASDMALNDVAVVQELALATPNGSISGRNFTSGGDIRLGSAGQINLIGATSGGLIDARSGGNLRLDNGSAPGPISLASTAGSVTSSGSLTAGLGLTATAFAGGRFNNLNAASVAIDVGGAATFTGLVTSPTIAVASSDIAILTTASIGGAGTSRVSLTVRPNGNQTVLGGDSQGPGYTLTDAEADRIRAQSLIVQAPAVGSGAARVPDLVVRDLSLSASRTGRVDIITPGIAQLDGELRLADAGAGNGLSLQADERLQIATPGAVRVVGTAGTSDGFLDVRSRNIWSASPSVLQQLVLDPNFAGRDAALLINNGSVNSRGSIEAGRVTLNVGNTLFVQNSGAFLDFAGITVRDGLTIVPTGAQPIQAFAFGRRINPDGSAVTGNEFFGQVAFAGRGTGYVDEAQFNLCFINSGACRLPAPGGGPPGGSDIVEEPVGLSFTVLLQQGADEDDLVDTSFAADPLIEEPVTSGGDSSLWEADCDRDDDGDCDAQDRP